MKIHDRRHSDSKKWHKYANTDIIPLWIADTDFEIAPEITDAALARLNHPIFGYPYDTEDFINAIINHCQSQYRWAIQPEWIVPIPGCVPGLNFSRSAAAQGGKNTAITTTPTYPPFFKNSAMLAGYQHICIPSHYEKQRWTIDFAALDAAVNADTGLLILCHPHNPIGRAYTEEELAQYHEIAKKHDLIVCSDEIHCDLVLNGSRHQPFASRNDDALKRTITLMAPSKTYNIAGQCCSYAIIADVALRRKFQKAALGLNDVNVLGRVMAAAAYSSGEPWRQQAIAYLRKNAAMIENRINAIAGLSIAPIEATYLAFIDCRGLGLDSPQQFFEQHGLGMADGADYGAPGFVRLNFGCSHELLDEALTRIEAAIASLH